jgi:hypothetical protein
VRRHLNSPPQKSPQANCLHFARRVSSFITDTTDAAKATNRYRYRSKYRTERLHKASKSRSRRRRTSVRHKIPKDPHHSLTVFRISNHKPMSNVSPRGMPHTTRPLPSPFVTLDLTTSKSSQVKIRSSEICDTATPARARRARVAMDTLDYSCAATPSARHLEQPRLVSHVHMPRMANTQHTTRARTSWHAPDPNLPSAAA